MSPDRVASAAQPTDQPPLVLVFEAVPQSFRRKKGQDVTTHRQAVSDEYERLLHGLRSAGLHVTTREGAPDSGTVLIFVRATSQGLYDAAARERMNDYLYGVRSSAQTPVNQTRTSSLPSDPKAAAPAPTSADLLRYTYSLVTEPACTDDAKRWHTISGAGVIPKSEAYPHVLDIVPLHDVQYNKSWLKQWTAPSSAFKIGTHELDSVRTQFGEEVALYFGWLVFYFNSLFPMAMWGFLFWVARRPYDIVYSVGLVAWSCVVVEAWRLRERKLAVRWGCAGVSRAERRRHDFKPRITRRDAVTGEEQEVFEWWRKEARMALAVPVMALFAALLGAVLTTMFVIEVFIAKMYTGPGRALVPLVPTALFTTAVPSIMAVWQATATALTNFENHRTERSHSSALTIKMFSLQALVAYGALTLSAFVYIPFGQKVMDNLIDQGLLAEHVSLAVQRGDLRYNSDGKVHFDINPNRMHVQLFAVSVTSQAINAFTELVLPILLRTAKNWYAARAEKKTAPSSVRKQREPVVASALEQIALPRYDVFTDYAEMATQFGFITIWSSIWPLSPVIGFINNFFEIRSDAAKISLNARRPVPVRVESIGPWLEVLGFISWLAALVNAALLYLFERAPYANTPGHSAYATVLRQHSSSTSALAWNQTAVAGLAPSEPTTTDEKVATSTNALFVALLVAIASEHGYALFRSATRHVLERALWRGSKEAEALMQRDWQSRRTLLQMHERGSAQSKPAIQETLSDFWRVDEVSKDWIANTKTE